MRAAPTKSTELFTAYLSFFNLFRACRLKKKQQHEANKVKLHGLQSEQGLRSNFVVGFKEGPRIRSTCWHMWFRRQSGRSKAIGSFLRGSVFAAGRIKSHTRQVDQIFFWTNSHVADNFWMSAVIPAASLSKSFTHGWCCSPLLENLMFIINDMKNEIVNRAQYPRKSGSSLSEKFKNMAKKAFGKCL